MGRRLEYEVKTSVRLNMSNPQHVKINDVIQNLDPKIFKSKNQFIIDAIQFYIDKDNENNLYRNALFGNVCNGEVRNLGVKDAEIWIDPNDGSAAGKGILVDILRGSKITNCWTSGSVTGGSSIEKNIGGMVALCDSAVSGSMDFEGCINHGRIYGSSYSGGMIASYKDCSSDIETNINCISGLRQNHKTAPHGEALLR